MSDHATRTNGRIAATNEDTRRVPRWVDRKAYPFKSLFMATPAGRMHYLDEGKGAVVLFVHGNPSWSFEHRSVIRYLRSTHRCVAPDHIGFGLSDKPYAASYLPQFHAANLKIFIDDLRLKDITLVLHDWGGPIGMSYALEHPENIKSIIVYNSWFWGVRDIKPLRIFSAIVGGPIGRFFCRHFNAFPRLLIPASVGDKSKLRHETLEHFIRPFPTPRSRKGTWVFPKAIIGESKWLNSLWAKRSSVQGKPLLLLWGLKDTGFGPALLDRWKDAFPLARAITFADIGHMAPEELGDRAIAPILAFLDE